MARKAKSLETLLRQVNQTWPNRSKVSDGWIGDTAHQARKSDHNANAAGVVQALDITHDPAHGVDTWQTADVLRQRRDPRIKYVISNGRIFGSDEAVRLGQSQGPAWTWRPYTGSNKHAHHVHVSVLDDSARYDDPSEWRFDGKAGNLPPPPAPPPRGITAEMRDRMARAILAYEARRDAAGHLAVYVATDGSREVAGINETYHPTEAGQLQRLLASGQYEAAEAAARKFIIAYTNSVMGWTTDAGVEFYLRDCYFNRGPAGAAKILQMALKLSVDGQVGPTTRERAATADPAQLLLEMRRAREQYEIVTYGNRAALWAGLTNRWNNSLKAAQEFQREAKPSIAAPVVVGTGAVVVGGGAVVASKNKIGWDGIIAIGLVVAIVAVVAGTIIYRRLRK